MKKKLIKKLTTMIIGVAMVTAMVIGISMPTKAAPLELRCFLNEVKDIYEFYLVDDGESLLKVGDIVPSGTKFYQSSTYNEKVYLVETQMVDGQEIESDVQVYSINASSAVLKLGPIKSPEKPDKPANKTEKKKSESKYIAPKEENPAFTHPDREKLKSILPQKTVIALEGNLYDDLKVFNADEKTKVNQALLVNNFAQTAGKKARIILTDTLHTNRMLGADNGRAKTLIWANLEKGPQAVYALCYNQNEKAYFISGILDKDGTATFNDFILRDMTNITIFVLE